MSNVERLASGSYVIRGRMMTYSVERIGSRMWRVSWARDCSEVYPSMRECLAIIRRVEGDDAAAEDAAHSQDWTLPLPPWADVDECPDCGGLMPLGIEAHEECMEKRPFGRKDVTR